MTAFGAGPEHFPNRPDHPDFWLMSRILIDQDKVTESGGEAAFIDLVDRMIDRRTLVYVAQQRALRVRDSLYANDPISRLTAGAGIWMDAFMAGVAFQAAKAKEEL